MRTIRGLMQPTPGSKIAPPAPTRHSNTGTCHSRGEEEPEVRGPQRRIGRALPGRRIADDAGADHWGDTLEKSWSTRSPVRRARARLGSCRGRARAAPYSD